MFYSLTAGKMFTMSYAVVLNEIIEIESLKLTDLLQSDMSEHITLCLLKKISFYG